MNIQGSGPTSKNTTTSSSSSPPESTSIKAKIAKTLKNAMKSITTDSNQARYEGDSLKASGQSMGKVSVNLHSSSGDKQKKEMEFKVVSSDEYKRLYELAKVPNSGIQMYIIPEVKSSPNPRKFNEEYLKTYKELRNQQKVPNPTPPQTDVISQEEEILKAVVEKDPLNETAMIALSDYYTTHKMVNRGLTMLKTSTAKAIEAKNTVLEAKIQFLIGNVLSCTSDPIPLNAAAHFYDKAYKLDKEKIIYFKKLAEICKMRDKIIFEALDKVSLG